MDHVDEIAIEDLQEALDNVDGGKPTRRLLAAIAYKKGVTQTELAEWYDVERRTIYSWLNRLDTDESLEYAVTDASRSGRPRKLSEDEQDELEETLHDTPRKVGYDAGAWTPTLAKHHLEETYDVEYSIPSCRRLLKEAGLRYHKPRSRATKTDAEGSVEADEDPKEPDGRWLPR